ncbi:LOW QUALITY PROTEIN: probable multidrug resistance-associated protein lethal(2)03659 [Leptinotarsa decemlineata]|uniref:LOW QUALITY PROTEIN: probable multidrug resistance-associated protein lethal(2)03659 n=1 Tax=Leptinotarsa decemlineata TaxID=7539 RepID=UPI003D30D6CE
MNIREEVKRQKNPRESANVLSRITFAYTACLFKKGLKCDLQEKDLYEVISSCNSNKCGNRLGKQWKLQNRKSSSPSIIKLIWVLFGWKYILMGCTKMTVTVIRSILEPNAVSSLVSYFKPGQTDISKNDAYFHALVVLMLYIFDCFFVHNYTLWVQQMGIEMKVAFSSFLYRKSLKLTPAEISRITLGNVVTLITKDVNTFVDSIQMLNDLAIGSVQTVVVCYLIYNKMGVTSLIGIAVLFCTLPIQGFIGNWTIKVRLALGKKCDERLQIIQESLSFIKIVKMYTWESYFIKKINTARTKELSKMLLGFFLNMTMLVTGLLFASIGFYVFLSTNIWMGFPTDTTLLFYLVSNLKHLKQALGNLVARNITIVAQCYAAVTRIKRLMNAGELHPKIGVQSEPKIHLKKGTVRLEHKELLKNITFRAGPGLTVVTGRVGSGKSLLLKTILQEYPLESGSLVCYNNISYSSQDPWLFPSSLRQNIIFGEKFNETRYSEVVKVCALEYDFSLFPEGDATIITDRGLNLSKGQQARINLARAIYRKSEIYLLDDPLADLDVNVQSYVFQECIQKYLKDKICVFVCQTAAFIQEANNVFVMENGKYQVQEEECEITTSETEHLLKPPVERGNIYMEKKKSGIVNYGVYMSYIKCGGGLIALFFVVSLVILLDFSGIYSKGLLTEWIDKRQHFLDLRETIAGLQTNYSNSTIADKINSLQKSYEEAESQEQYSFLVYSVLLLSSNALLLVKCFAVLNFCRRSSVNLHKKMINRVVRAPMAFYDTHFIGNILNRFSQDLVNVDEYLPTVIDESFRAAVMVFGHSWLIVSVNIKFVIYVIIIIIMSFVLRLLYLPAGRSLKRLESATRSPMIGHLNASLEGLTTIRACKAQDILEDEFDRHQDLYTSAFYTSTYAMEAFQLALDSLCSIFVVLVIIGFIVVDTDVSAGNVGLAIMEIMYMGEAIRYLNQRWSQLETLMTSAERVLEYSSASPESEIGNIVENWPNYGAVDFEDVSLSYKSKMVLKHVSFRVKPGQHIGIVGRTGAGKSSLISSIFRLYDIEGKIKIDGVDIKTLSLKFLRRNIVVIPQNFHLFSGTIRSNLDPYNEFSDEDLWNALGKVNIKKSIDDLNMKVESRGSNFSSGQKQLIYLARAVLRRTKIIVLDEATANMDNETDILLNEVMKNNFEHCTIFKVSHRLECILECDKILVLEKGEIKEFDNTATLLENEEGHFYALVKQAGLLNYLN